ncbi:hypothetical protein B0H17DRAFT_1200760 [Mycena rosella]|uniref:Uncharacterized protein n=1 Tax=Mycena rosella TaxID=1033263 RepID=A0AAD7GFB7_MYCRO|nr:hypothetical protein B0H17DRAFT_1200760 [Mycena rosella]
MKSCLKSSSPSPPGSPGAMCRKSVAFPVDEEAFAEIHWADEWDRSPTERASDLSHQELQELEEIQQSLPYAPQPGKHILSTVSITLLPLATSSSPPSPSLASVSPSLSQSHPFVMPPSRVRATAARPPVRLACPALTHLCPPPPAAPRPKPVFAFLPLLPSSAAPAALSTNASASAPGSHLHLRTRVQPATAAMSYFPAPVEPSRALPPARATMNQSPSQCTKAHSGLAEAAACSAPFGSSAYDYKKDRAGLLGCASERREVPIGKGEWAGAGAGAKRRKTRKSFMVINDEVVEIEEDDGEEDGDYAADGKAGEVEEERAPACALASVSKIEPTAYKSAASSAPASPTVRKDPPMAAKADPLIPAPPTPPSRMYKSPPSLPSPVEKRMRSPSTPLPLPTTHKSRQTAERLSPVQPRASSRLVLVRA